MIFKAFRQYGYNQFPYEAYSKQDCARLKLFVHIKHQFIFTTFNYPGYNKLIHNHIYRLKEIL